MNKFNPPNVLPLVLGAKVVPPTPVPVTTVELKPYLFLDKLTGRMVYLPPEPTTPEKAKKPKVATAPKAEKPKLTAPSMEKVVWHHENPPEDGWYIATRDARRPTDRARYWDGVWSRYTEVATLMNYPDKRSIVPGECGNDDGMVWWRMVEFPA